MEFLFVIFFLAISFFLSADRERQIEEDAARNTIPNLEVSLTGLIAIIMNADGQATKAELAEVKLFFLKKFGEQQAKRLLLILKQMLQREILDFRPHCLQLNRSFSSAERLDFLTLLFRIAKANNGICETEMALLERIARHTAIQRVDFLYLQNQYASDYQQRKRAASYAVPDIRWAYKTLSIDENASEQEIKKAYRKLAMKYHPDKINAKDLSAQTDAAEKFRKINEAYECLKTKKYS